MAMDEPHSKPPPKSTHYVSPAKRMWLDHLNRQLAYDEYMQVKREFWLAERRSKRGTG